MKIGMMTMSKLKVEIDYIKISQYVKMIEYYQKKIGIELDRAVLDQQEEE